MFKKQTPKTKEQARQYAIDWQNWAYSRKLSYKDIAIWSDILRELAKKFHLVREFKENGII